MAYDRYAYDLDTCMDCPSAAKVQPPCQRVQRYTDGSVVPILKDDLGISCPFAASWETIRDLALKYPNIPRTNQDGFYAIGKIRTSMDLRKKLSQNPGYQLGQMDPIYGRILTANGRSRLAWQDDSNKRFYYFLQAVNVSDYSRFEEWFKRACIGPVPSDLDGKARIVWIRSLDYIQAALLGQFQSLFTWQNLVIMSASAAIMIGAALQPAGWILWVRNVTVAFGLGSAFVEAAGSLTSVAVNISGSASRRDLERAAVAFATFESQLAALGVLTVFFGALMKGANAWMEAGRGKFKGFTDEVPAGGKPRMLPQIPDAVMQRAAEITEEARTRSAEGCPFFDDPGTSSLPQLQGWLRSRGFHMMRQARTYLNSLDQPLTASSEIWFRGRPDIMAEGFVEAIRIDILGHGGNPSFAGAHPHFHAETIPLEYCMDYLDRFMGVMQESYGPNGEHIPRFADPSDWMRQYREIRRDSTTSWRPVNPTTPNYWGRSHRPFQNP